jgi:hypothetical protein
MIVRADAWTTTSTGEDQRTITAANLAEISLVHKPANPNAQLTSVRADRTREGLEVRYSPSGLAVVTRADPNCARCGGAGTVELNCPNCSAEEITAGSDADPEGDRASRRKRVARPRTTAEAKLALRPATASANGNATRYKGGRQRSQTSRDVAELRWRARAAAANPSREGSLLQVLQRQANVRGWTPELLAQLKREVERERSR